MRGGYLALALSAVSVNGGTGELEIVQVVVQTVARTFGFDKHQGTCGRLFEEEIHQTLFLVKFFNVEDLSSAMVANGTMGRYTLSDVVGGTSDTTDFDKDVIVRQKVAREVPHRLGESCAKHERLAGNCSQYRSPLGDTVFGEVFQNFADIGFKTHVKHTIRLVQDEITAIRQGEIGILPHTVETDVILHHCIQKTSRGSNEDITPFLQLCTLRSPFRAAINDTKMLAPSTRFWYHGLNMLR